MNRVILEDKVMKGRSTMAVEYENIIQKMITELQQAKATQHNHAAMKRHIAKVHVLSELVLDESPTINTGDQITDLEIKAMLGNEQVKINNEKTSKNADADDSASIFDF